MAFPMFMYSFLIEMTLPNSPGSPTRKYRLTAKGKDFLAREGQELMDYGAVLNNKSLQLIDIDPDDGVKANYAKFEELVGKV